MANAIRLTDVTKDRPVDHVICGIVDTVEVGGTAVYSKRAGLPA